MPKKFNLSFSRRWMLAIIMIISFIFHGLAQSGCLVPENVRYIQKQKAQFDRIDPDKQEALKERIKEYIAPLKVALDSIPYYRAERNKRIKELSSRADGNFDISKQLLREYLNASFDSAYQISLKMLDMATDAHNPDMVSDAHALMSEVFVSGGYFRGS